MMSEEECLWLRVTLFEETEPLVQSLVSVGILTHQTMARASASNTRRSLSTLVPEHLQGALTVFRRMFSRHKTEPF